jgi:hypothetical protein
MAPCNWVGMQLPATHTRGQLGLRLATDAYQLPVELSQLEAACGIVDGRESKSVFTPGWAITTKSVFTGRRAISANI